MTSRHHRSHVRDFEQHEAARSWFDAQFGNGGRVGLPWASLLGFLRLVTNPRVFERPEPTASAWQQVEEWLDRDGAWVPEAGTRHQQVLASLLARVTVTDGAFARFPDLRWINPLIAN